MMGIDGAMSFHQFTFDHIVFGFGDGMVVRKMFCSILYAFKA